MLVVGWATVVGGRGASRSTRGATCRPFAGLRRAISVDQCLANLVENVARHTPETATAWIRAHPYDDGGPAGVEIEVEDDGPGVDAEATRHLFERFYRGRASRSGTGGMGIGLAIVRGLTEAMGGTVSAARGSAGGLLSASACRRCRHPGKIAPRRERRAAPAVRRGRGRRPRAHGVEPAGARFRVTPAGTAAEGLAAWEADRADVILLDLGLPDRDGDL